MRNPFRRKLPPVEEVHDMIRAVLPAGARAWDLTELDSAELVERNILYTDRLWPDGTEPEADMAGLDHLRID